MRSISRQVQEWYNARFYKSMRSKLWQFKETTKKGGTWEPSQDRVLARGGVSAFGVGVPGAGARRKAGQRAASGVWIWEAELRFLASLLAAREFLNLLETQFSSVSGDRVVGMG